MVHPQSEGTLYLPGQYSTAAPPALHSYKVSSTGPEGVEVESILMGSEERYTKIYKVRNYRDSPTFVTLSWDKPSN